MAHAQTDPGYTVVATFPHDEDAFTEGLAFRRGHLFEGTGLRGHSEVRRVDLETGNVLRRHALPDRFFGEGITLINKQVFQLTFQEHRAWAYGARRFKKHRRFNFKGEGWGLTDNGQSLVMSNGTNVIRFRNPHSFKVQSSIHVTDGDEPVDNLNELEWVDGEIYANVWPTNEVVRIDPSSGDITGRLDLSMLAQQEEGCDPDATNGIAYMQSEQRLFVTGKYWCHLYEIEPTG